MSLPELSIRRPVTTLMVYVGVLLFGIISLKLLSQELFPPISYPKLTIVSRYENAAPEEIETLITKPIEEAVGGISGLRKVTSTSREGLSLVVAEFGWNQKMDFASLAIREKIDLIKERLPRDASEPIVIKFNPFEQPVMVLSISSDKRSPVQLREISRRIFKDEIEKIHGVASAGISGGAEEQILIDVDQNKLNASGVSIVQVSDAIAAANLNYPGGTIKESFYEYLVRTLGEFKHVSEVGEIPLKSHTDTEEIAGGSSPENEKPSNRLVLLKDVASIDRTVKERTSFSRYNGLENITVSVQKQAQANTVRVTGDIKKRILELKKEVPEDIRIDIISDQSKSINNALGGVGDAAIQGGILAFIVLYIFLKDFVASALVVTITPVTVLATFVLMYFMGVSLNVISLGGIALGVGMLLDNAVVLIENVTRKIKEEPALTLKQAAGEGSNEVIAPMFASTLTTVSVFLPMVFVIGLAGQLFKQLALVVVVTQVISAIIAFTLLSMLIAFMPALLVSIKGFFGNFSESSIWKSWSRLVQSFLSLAYLPIQAIEKTYDKMLPEFIKRKWFYLLVVLGLFLFSLFALTKMDRILLPKIDQGEFTVRLSLPVGSRVEFTDTIAKRVEKYIQQIPEVKTVSAIVGSSKSDTTKDVIESLGAHEANIIVSLHDRRVLSTDKVVQKVRNHFELSEGRDLVKPARLNYILNDSAFGVGSGENDSPVVVEIKGPKLEELRSIAGKVEERLSKVKGLYGISNSIAEASPETKIIINKDRASYYRLSVVSIAQAANIAMKGITASKFKEEGREIDIRVQLKEKDRDQFQKLAQLMIRSPLELDVPLGDFVKFERGRGPSEITRVSQERTVHVYAKLHDRPLKDTIEEVQATLKKIPMRERYVARIAGESEEIQESFASLQFAFILSIILVYMIMAAQFESLWQPFIIMFCLPLSLIGVAASLWVFQTPISVVAILGIILLGGIVVNNGIILIDFINQLRKEGKGLHQSAFIAGRTRLRPILMTAFSSAAGALPLALGKGEAALQAPLGVTAIGGILIATFLTLVVIPAVYVGTEEFKARFKKRH